MHKRDHHSSFIWLLALLTIALAALIYWRPNLKGTQTIIQQILPSPKKEVDKTSTTFILAGDIMLGRAVNAAHPDQKLDEIYANLPEGFFYNRDLAMANLEGPISADPVETTFDDKSMVFNFSPYTGQFLKNLGLNTVSLANNHTNNQGPDGFLETVRNLTTNNITPVGKSTGTDSSSIARFGQNGHGMSVIAVNLLDFQPDLTGYIAQEKKAGNFVLIYPHWGTEYAANHSASQEKLAHAWIDAGADLVVGSHPHVIEDAEVYKNKPIFYSLGNFIFDQNFSNETETGLVIAGKVQKDQLSLTLLPIKIDHYKPTLLAGDEKLKIINNLRKSMRFLVATDPESNELVLKRPTN